MIELKKSEAREKILQAYEEKRLSAQNGSDRCRYRDLNGHPCAIGVLLDEDTAKSFDSLESIQAIGALIKSELITTDDDTWFKEVQACHDNWLAAERSFTTKGAKKYPMELVRKYELNFINVVINS